METIDLVTGDPLIKTIGLEKDNAAFNIPSGTTVKAAVVSYDRKQLLTSIATVSELEDGSDWAQSTIVVNISKAETAAITEYGQALLEIQVADGNEETWFIAVNIIQGQID